ncbi:MAG: branched-chain amino acid ABC transporter permease [Deltaproteobacteria bacterium]|jgi:branched-chain amino acid transport system permease protein|nr:branched-chain amino acid ABC transporter permease [Deltaproteobacteria bacterium]
MLLNILQLLVNGILHGGIYALISIGLTMIWGVMQIVNFAHGEFLMLGMYASFWVFTLYGVDPYLALLIIMPGLFLLGVLTQWLVISPILDAPHAAQIFATVGLSIVLQNLALFAWKGDYRNIRLETSISNVKVMGLVISFPRLMAFLITLGMVIALFFFLKKTYLGKALRATADNKRSAQLMGINVSRLYYLALGIGTACVGAAGGILMPMYSVFPTVGSYFVLTAFVVVVLGGMGSMAGAFVGGLIIGVVEAFSGFFLAPALKEVVYFLVFVLILVFKPSGLMGKVKR